MRVIATEMGIILSFPNRKDLEGTIGNLQGMFKWTEKENVDPPYLYAIYENDIPVKKINKLLDEIKDQGKVE